MTIQEIIIDPGTIKMSILSDTKSDNVDIEQYRPLPLDKKMMCLILIQSTL